MRQLVQRLDNFDDSNLIASLSFPRLFRSTTNAVHQSEGAACTTVPSFLDEPVITVYSAYALSEARFSIPGMVMTCSKIVNVLLERSLSDTVLSEAYQRFTDGRQREDETEIGFATRFESYVGDRRVSSTSTC